MCVFGCVCCLVFTNDVAAMMIMDRERERVVCVCARPCASVCFVYCVEFYVWCCVCLLGVCVGCVCLCVFGYVCVCIVVLSFTRYRDGYVSDGMDLEDETF